MRRVLEGQKGPRSHSIISTLRKMEVLCQITFYGKTWETIQSWL